MTSSKRSFLFSGVLAVSVFIGMLLYAGPQSLLDSATSLGFDVILFGIALTSVGYLFRFLKWEYLMRSTGVSISLLQSSRIFFSGLMMVVTPGKLGEFWKAWLAENEAGIKKTQTSSVVILDRLTDLLALSIFSVLGAALFSFEAWSVILIFLVISAFLVFEKSERASKLVFLVISSFLSRNISEKLRGLRGDIQDLSSVKVVLVSLSLSLVSWSLEAGVLLMLVFELGYGFGLLNALSVFGVSSIAGAVSMLPGGLGSAEASMVGLLQFFSLGKSDAVAVTAATRIVTLWYGSFLGLAVYAHWRSGTFVEKIGDFLDSEEPTKSRF